MDTVSTSIARFGLRSISPIQNGVHTIQLIQKGGIQMSLDEMMLRMEIAEAIKAIPLGEENAQLNAYGMQLLAVRIALGQHD
jgi:hypothetical protein